MIKSGAEKKKSVKERKMKKQSVLLLFLYVVLLSGLFAVTCSANVVAEEEDEQAVFTVGDVTCGAGESVQVPISFNGERGICGATIRFSLDNGVKLTSIQAGPAFSTLSLTRPGNLDTLTPVLLWDGIEEEQSNGVIAVLTCMAPEEEGTYQINARYEEGDIIDGSLENVEATIISGSITVGSSVDNEPDFILPSALTTIEEEAFVGGSFEYVKLSEYVTYIGSKAFADCSNLKHIYIPQTTNRIEDDAFDGVGAFIIHGVSGSYAEDYANEHGIIFQSE